MRRFLMLGLLILAVLNPLARVSAQQEVGGSSAALPQAELSAGAGVSTDSVTRCNSKVPLYSDMGGKPIGQLGLGDRFDKYERRGNGWAAGYTNVMGYDVNLIGKLVFVKAPFCGKFIDKFKAADSTQSDVAAAQSQDSVKKKQDSTKKSGPKTSAKSNQTTRKTTPAPPVVVPAQGVDTSITNQEARRKQFVMDSTKDADRRLQDSLTIVALKQTTAEAISRERSALHRQGILDDSLKRIQKSPSATSANPPVRSGTRVPISKDQPTAPPRSSPTVVPPTIVVHDYDTTTVYKTDTLRLTGPTVYLPGPTTTVHDTVSHTTVVKSGHNPWPWIFGIAVVAGATTYLVCHNNNNCRSPRSNSCAINVVNPGSNQIPGCPAASKSRGVGVSWGLQF